MDQLEALQELGICIVQFLIGLVVIWFLLRVAIYALAKQNRMFTLREEGKFKYHMRSGKLQRILYKLKDEKVYLATGKVVPEAGAGDEQATWFEFVFGALWIGIVPNEILEFPVSYDREPRPGDPEDKPGYKLDKSHKILHRSDRSTFMFNKRVYPIVARGVELSDRIKVDVFGTITIKVFNAYLPVFGPGEGWFGHVRDAAEGAMNDWIKGFSLEKFTDEPKSSSLTPHGLELKILSTSPGTQHTTGMGIIAFNFKEWRETPGDPEVELASRAEKVALLNGQARIATANAEAKAITAIGDATAGAARAYVGAVGSSAIGARALMGQQLSQGITGHKGTLVLGGNTGTILPLSSDDSSDSDASRGTGDANPPTPPDPAVLPPVPALPTPPAPRQYGNPRRGGRSKKKKPK